jgi:hypothetical protein
LSSAWGGNSEQEQAENQCGEYRRGYKFDRDFASSHFFLRPLQVRFETNRILSSQREILSARFVCDFGDTGLTELCFPRVPAKSTDAGGINGVNDDAVALAVCARSIRIREQAAARARSVN